MASVCEDDKLRSDTIKDMDEATVSISESSPERPLVESQAAKKSDDKSRGASNKAKKRCPIRFILIFLFVFMTSNSNKLITRMKLVGAIQGTLL